MIKMNYLKVGAAMSLLLAGTSILGASLANNKGVGLFAQETPCSHEGNHYAEVKPTATTSGHREFYACCKCHEAWLENPGGAFVNQEESKMSAVLGDGHVAYLPKLTDTLSVTDENSLKDGSKYGYTSLQLKNDLDLTNHEAYSFDSIDLDGIILDLNGKTITSYNGGVAYDGRNFTIKNGNFVAKDNGSYALFAGNEGYDDASCVIDDVVLTGGINVYTIDATIKSTNGKTVINGTNYYAVYADEKASSKVTIEGGVFHKGGSDTIGKGEPCSFTLKGGTFDNLTEEQKTWVAPGYKTVEDGGKISVVKDENVVFISTVEELTALATDVNGGNSYAGKTIFLTADLDLSSIANWTPIGNSTTPFAGSFDGGNHTIKNLTCSATETCGLFGYINGSANGSYLVSSDLYSNGEFNYDNISESNYSAVIKNLTLKDVDIDVTSKKHAGALVAISNNAYIENVNVDGGTIDGVKVVGGIAGAAYGSTIYNCSVSSNTTITASGYHAGGIVGASNTASSTYRLAIADCTNSATIVCHGNGSGYAGGIIGDANNTNRKALVIYNCINNGSIEASGEFIAGIVGNVNINASEEAPIVANCTNNGNIVANSEETAKNVGGIESNAAGLIENCTNNGDISGNITLTAGGIVSNTYQTSITLSNVSNTGDLSNVTTATTKDIIAKGYNLVTVKNMSFANVAALEEVVSNISTSLSFENLTVTDMTGTFHMVGANKDLTSDKQYFAGLDISSVTESYVTVTIPNFVYQLHGDAITKTLGLSGANNVTTFASDCKLDWLRNYGSGGKYILETGAVVNTIHGADPVE